MHDQDSYFSKFSIYLKAFMQRIVTRFPIIKDFLNYEKTQMLEKFPDVIPTNVESHPSEISHMKYALDSS